MLLLSIDLHRKLIQIQKMTQNYNIVNSKVNLVKQ